MNRNNFPRLMSIVVGASLLLFFIGGIWFLRAQQKQQGESVKANLWSIANLKAKQITDWRSERLSDATILMGRRGLIQSIERYLMNPTEQDKSQILRRLRPIKEHYHYDDILVVNLKKQVVLSLGSKGDLCPEEHVHFMDEAIKKHHPRWTSLHVSHDWPYPHISIVVPLSAEDNIQNPIGTLVMICDAAQFLYPLLQSWPTPSATAETLLIGRDGNEVLFLNDLRHRKDTALNLRIPLSRKDLPAAKALRGITGIVKGKDYRGVEVIAAILPVPNSPWFMVSKVDTDEAFAEWRFRSIMILVFVFGVMGLVLATGFVVWQRNLKTYYQDLYQSEATLNKALNRHRITLQSIGDAVITTDVEGRVELMNPLAENLTGWEKDSAKGKALSEVFHIVNEETRDPLKDPSAKVLNEAKVIDPAKHALLISKDGRETPISDTGSPIRDENDEIIGVVLVFRDQTVERMYQNQILEHEEKYRLLANNTLDVIWTMNMGLELTYVNPAIKQLTGHEPDEFVNTKLSEHCDKAQFTKIAGLITQEAAKGYYHKGVVFETQMLRKDKTTVPVEIHGLILFDENENPVGLQGTTRDITERKQAEKTLRNYSEKLEELVEERTKKLKDIQEQLVRKEKLSILGQLAGGVGHELRNPLGVISNAVYYLKMVLPDAEEKIKEYLETISSEVERATKIVSDLLDFSRIKSIDKEPAKIADLIFQVLDQRPAPKKIEIVTKIDPNQPVVFVDPRQMIQILDNLIANAYQAMNEGGKLILETKIKKNNMYVSVTDTGCGISREKMKKVFEPLFTTKARGIGLGLAVSKNLIEANNGSIKVSSEEGKGSRFTLIFPIKESRI